jgi:hypothetical protein
MTPVLGVECALPKDFRPYESDEPRRGVRWAGDGDEGRVSSRRALPLRQNDEMQASTDGIQTSLSFEKTLL